MACVKTYPNAIIYDPTLTATVVEFPDLRKDDVADDKAKKSSSSSGDNKNKNKKKKKTGYDCEFAEKMSTEKECVKRYKAEKQAWEAAARKVVGKVMAAVDGIKSACGGGGTIETGCIQAYEHGRIPPSSWWLGGWQSSEGFLGTPINIRSTGGVVNSKSIGGVKPATKDAVFSGKRARSYIEHADDSPDAVYGYFEVEPDVQELRAMEIDRCYDVPPDRSCTSKSFGPMVNDWKTCYPGHPVSTYYQAHPNYNLEDPVVQRWCTEWADKKFDRYEKGRANYLHEVDNESKLLYGGRLACDENTEMCVEHVNTKKKPRSKP